MANQKCPGHYSGLSGTKHICTFVLMQMCACLKEHIRKVIDYVFYTVHGLLGQCCSLESPRLQQAKHATSTKHLVSWVWSVFWCSDTNAISEQPFSWFWSQEMTKGPQPLMAKPTTALTEIVYIIVILSYISASNCFLNHLILWLLFFQWFHHGKNAACKKQLDWITLKFGIFP